MGERIFVKQMAYTRLQRRKEMWKAIFILMGLAGLGVFIGIFIVEGLAIVERVESTVSLWWYIVAGTLIIPSLISSIWNIFWFQAIFAFLKKRGGGGVKEGMATRGIGWAERRRERGYKT